MAKKKYNGYVYILKIWIDTDVAYKIGTTNRDPYNRLLEIAGELYSALGYIPKMTIVRQQRVLDNYAVEAQVLQETAKYRYSIPCVKEVCGESEMRQMNEQEIYRVYDKCILKSYPAKECYKVEI